MSLKFTCNISKTSLEGLLKEKGFKSLGERIASNEGKEE